MRVSKKFLEEFDNLCQVPYCHKLIGKYERNEWKIRIKI